MNWIIIPYLDCPDFTRQAVADALAQRLENVRILLVNNGSQTPEGRAVGHELVRQYDGSVYLWNYDPALPSLAAVWNAALHFVWGTGADQALVINNDVRLHPDLYYKLLAVRDATGAEFVSACNVGEAWAETEGQELAPLEDLLLARGGPDFSCYLITQNCHQWFQFDEGFVPAYHEDNDFHRRLQLAGWGEKIFSVCVPYLHIGSGTLKSHPTLQEGWQAKFALCQDYYQSKWGGLPHHETFTFPFNKAHFDGTAGYAPQSLYAGQGRGERELDFYKRVTEALYGEAVV